MHIRSTRHNHSLFYFQADKRELYVAHSRGITPRNSLMLMRKLHPPSNPPKGFQRFDFLRHFCAGVRTYLGYRLGLHRVTSTQD